MSAPDFEKRAVPAPGPPPSGPTFSSPEYGRPGPASTTSFARASDVSSSDRGWAAGAHLSSFLAAYVALGFIGPLVIFLIQGEKSPYVRKHAVEALNFNLTWLVYIVVAYLSLFVLVGLILLPLVGIAYVILVIMATIAANEGRDFRYPLTVRLVS